MGNSPELFFFLLLLLIIWREKLSCKVPTVDNYSLSLSLPLRCWKKKEQNYQFYGGFQFSLSQKKIHMSCWVFFLPQVDMCGGEKVGTFKGKKLTSSLTYNTDFILIKVYNSWAMMPNCHAFTRNLPITLYDCYNFEWFCRSQKSRAFCYFCGALQRLPVCGQCGKLARFVDRMFCFHFSLQWWFLLTVKWAPKTLAPQLVCILSIWTWVITAEGGQCKFENFHDSDKIRSVATEMIMHPWLIMLNDHAIYLAQLELVIFKLTVTSALCVSRAMTH